MNIQNCCYDILNLSNNTKYLILDNKFNNSIDNLLNGISYLKLGYSFNQSIDNLPSSVIYLKLGDSFNQQIDYLPSSITHLILGNSFNQKIDDLPINLLFLSLGNNFNNPINNLPNSLVRLELANDFNQFVHKLPNDLIHLKLNIKSFDSDNIINKFVKKLTKLNITVEKIKLLTNVKKITLGDNFNFDLDSFSDSVEIINFGKGFYKKKINKLPKNIKEIIISEPSQYDLVDDKYKNLITKYDYGNNLNKEIKKIPESIEQISISNPYHINHLPEQYRHKIKNLKIFKNTFDLSKIPDFISYVIIGEEFILPLDLLPDTIKIIKLQCEYNTPINKLPKQIEKIYIERIKQKKLIPSQYHEIIELF
jgi:hypothetical protein